MGVSCLDLKVHFGDRFRVIHEESYLADHGEHGRAQDLWLLLIPCRHGHIYPHGGEMLGASTNRRGAVARHITAQPCVSVVQDGDDGVNVVFPMTDFDTVAAIMKPKRRRRLSAEQIAERTERLRKYQFSPASQNAGSDRICDPDPDSLPRAA
jgi:hypothetical protein